MKLIDIKGKNVFLSGPMTGLEHYNVEAFAKAHAQLKELGAKHVYNPGISYLTSEKKESHEYWMRRCVHEMTYGYHDGAPYDLVVQLKGWSKSEGCRTEAQVASACGIPCVTMKRVLKDAETLKKNRAAMDETAKGVMASIAKKHGLEFSPFPYDHVTEA